ncbi:hypothetical protein M0P48_04575 [Candidatus Gracilibacteria bacterium]|nr:hypothetical protein [Candidatus Gracilibacteria bacterium]
MNNKKSFFKLVAIFSTITFLFGTFAYMATASDWIGDEQEILDYNKGYVRPTTPIQNPPIVPDTTPVVPDVVEPVIPDTTPVVEPVAPDYVAPVVEPVIEPSQEISELSEPEKSAVDVLVTQQPVPEASEVGTEDVSTSIPEMIETGAVEVEALSSEIIFNTITDTISSAEAGEGEQSEGVYTVEIKNIVKDSLNVELQKVEDRNIYIGNGEYLQISSDSDLNKFVKVAQVYAGTEKLGTNDFNNNNIEDVLEAGVTGNISFSPVEKQQANDQIVYGVTEQDAGKTVFVAVPNLSGKNIQQVVGSEPLFKAKVLPEAGEDITSVQDKKLSIKVVDEKYKVVYSELVKTDDGGIATYSPSKKLNDGTYFVTVSDENGEVVDAKKIVVNAKKVPLAPKLALVSKENNEKNSFVRSNDAPIGVEDNETLMNQKEDSFDFTNYLLENYLYKYFPYLDPKTEDVIGSTGLTVTKGDVPKVIEGVAKPGEIVFVTWKSIVMSSVVIADATQGKFKIEVPSDLPEGKHEVIAFVYDPNNNFVGNLASFFFSK